MSNVKFVSNVIRLKKVADNYLIFFLGDYFEKNSKLGYYEK